MKAKTAKFLAVLAVLAMAFAAVAVFAPVESDADEVQSVWTTTAGSNWSLKLGTDVTIPTDGQTLEEAKVYYVNSDMSLVMSEDADLAAGGTLILLKSGVHVSVQVPQEHEKVIAFAVAGVDESKDKNGNTILTFYGDYTDTAFTAWVGDNADKKGFHYPTKWTGDAGAEITNTIIGNQAIGMDKAQGGGNFEFESGVTVDGNKKKVVYMAYTDVDCAWYLDAGYFANTFQYIYQYTEPSAGGAIWNMKDATGAIGSYRETNQLELNGFTGVIKMTDNKDITIEKWISGEFTVTKGTVKMGADATIPEGSSITFANGISVTNFSISFERFVVDKYTITTDGTIKAGADGFTITAGANGFELSGSATVTTAGSWTFKGAAKISGILNMNNMGFAISGDGYQITLENFRADNAVAGLTLSAETVFEGQVTVSGKVIAKNNMIVAPYAFVNITGEYRFVPATAGNLIYTFVGKDATLRVSQAVGPTSATSIEESSYTADDDRWATVAFVDVTGKFFLNQNLVTKASGAVVTYLYQIGEGQVSVNSSICSKYSYYYLYKQVIPYLLLNPVDVVCTSMIAEEAEISLRGVDYTETPVPTGNQARYNIDYTTGVPILTVFFKELYPVEIQDAYANGVAKIEVIDEDGKKVFMEPKDGALTTGIVRLAYTYDYIIKGVDEKNKYTFYRDVQPGDAGAAAKKLDQINLYSSEFQMVRGYMTYATAAQESNVPHFITYTEGLAVELTVILDDESYDQYSVGDVFMYFTTEVDEKGKPTGEGTPVVLSNIKVGQANKVGAIITEGVYSTDTVYFKSEYRLFYKLTAVNADSTNFVFPTVDATEAATVDFSSQAWSAGFKFTSSTVTKATLGVDCLLDQVKVTFTLPAMPAGKKVYVDFTTFCDKQEDHRKNIKLDEITVVTMCVGEVYEITWDDITGKFVTMSYDKTNPTTAAPKDYAEGTPVTATPVALTYTLKIQDITYVTVENKTDNDLKLTIGRFSADIAKGKSNDKVIVNDSDSTLVLSKKGWTVEGWDFTITRGTADTTETTPCKTVHVSGPQTTQTFADLTALIQDSNNATTYVIKKITIVMTDMKKTLYNVDVPIDSHYAIDLYDRTGYMGDTQKVYITPIAEWTIEDVLYHYKEVDMTEEAVGHATRGTTPEGKEVWTYIMPASDVVLEPIYHKDARNLTFVDQDGVTVETMTKEPTTLVDMPVPVKPLCKVAGVTTSDLTEDEYDFNAETGYISFTMPDKDVVFTVTYVEIDYSTDVIVTVGQKGMPITLVITALDGKQIASGTIKMNVTYTYTDEDGEISTDVVTVTKNYVAGESTVITDQEFITLLGDNYSGAFAVTGTFEFGYAVGSLSKTVYTPVLGA